MKISAGILGFIVGDALGVPVEFFNRDSLSKNPMTDMAINNNRKTGIGFWSDDTAMTLCTMQSIIDKNKIDYIDLMNKFLDWLETGYMAINNRCFGIGQTTLKALINYKRKITNKEEIIDFDFGPNQIRNAGNGSLMRILPIALYLYSKNDFLNKKVKTIIEVSSLTHSNEDCAMSCVFYSFFIFNLLKKNDLIASFNNSIKEFKEVFNTSSNSKFNRILSKKIIYCSKEEIKSTGYVIDTLEASLWSLLTTDNYKEAVLKSANLGGDADTITAITGSMAGIYYGLESIPKEWINSIQEIEKIDNIITEFNSFLNKNQD